jgi:hypothetical protein
MPFYRHPSEGWDPVIYIRQDDPADLDIVIEENISKEWLAYSNAGK